MDLRPELEHRPFPPERLAWIRQEVLRVEALVDAEDPAAEAAIEALNAATGHGFTADDFRHHCGAPDRDELVEWASAPPPVRVPDVTRAELIEVVRRILEDPGDEWYLEVFDLNTVMPDAVDLIHHPPPGLDDTSAEAIVDAALAYRPIAL